MLMLVIVIAFVDKSGGHPPSRRLRRGGRTAATAFSSIALALVFLREEAIGNSWQKQCVQFKCRVPADRWSWLNAIFPSRSPGGSGSKLTRAAFATATHSSRMDCGPVFNIRVCRDTR